MDIITKTTIHNFLHSKIIPGETRVIKVNLGDIHGNSESFMCCDIDDSKTFFSDDLKIVIQGELKEIDLENDSDFCFKTETGYSYKYMIIDN